MIPPERVRGQMLWRSLETGGLEHCRLLDGASGHVLRGSVLSDAAGSAARIDYEVQCDARWRSHEAAITVTAPAGVRQVRLARRPGGGWHLDGAALAHDCDDIDLEFTPATNTLAVQRLRLSPGAQAPCRALWLRYPALQVEVLEQTYRRRGAFDYDYASGDFRARLRFHANGLVLDYGELWRGTPL